MKPHISTEWLLARLEQLKVYHREEMAQGRPADLHHGVVPDLICEILRQCNVEHEPFDWPSFPTFVSH